MNQSVFKIYSYYSLNFCLQTKLNNVQLTEILELKTSFLFVNIRDLRFDIPGGG